MTGKYIQPPHTGNIPKIEKLACPKCKGEVTLRAKGYTQSLVCQYCETILDVSGKKIDIIGRNQKSNLIEPLIPLGTRGKLHGVVWEVIGFMQRKSNQVDLTGMYYTWQEYLLFNPYKGFRWLTECRGHWNYVCTLHNLPKLEAGLFSWASWGFWDSEDTYNKKSIKNYTYLNERFVYHESYKATVTYVLGEFYWQVKVNDESTFEDYVHYTHILTLEKISKRIYSYTTSPTLLTQLHLGDNVDMSKAAIVADDEQNWSLAEYIEPQEIENAFQLVHYLPKKSGMMINQPITSKSSLDLVWKTSAAMCGILIVLAGLSMLFHHPKTVLNELVTVPVTHSTYTSQPFHIEGKYGELKIVMGDPRLSNSWIEAELQLVNEKTGKGTYLHTGLEYYSGQDYEGYWVEGSKWSSWRISRPPPGNYRLILNTDAGFYTPHTMQVIINEGEPSFDNSLLSILFLLIPGLLAFFYIGILEWKKQNL